MSKNIVVLALAAAVSLLSLQAFSPRPSLLVDLPAQTTQVANR